MNGRGRVLVSAANLAAVFLPAVLAVPAVQV